MKISENDIKKILKEKKINFDEFIKSKYSKKYKIIKREIFRKLIEMGFKNSQIAKIMGYNKSTVGRIIK